MSRKLTLVSHALCPYVQRAAIVLAEKGQPFERIDIDLANKPQWFLDISPLGKTPVLLVDRTPIFESAVICEYLDDTLAPRLHPEDALERARHRAWMEFASAMLNAIWLFYTAPTERALQARATEIGQQFDRVEAVLGDGPWFAGERFSIVDAAFAPVFRYFDVFDAIADFGFFAKRSKVVAWRRRLMARDTVRDAVRAEYPDLLGSFLLARNSALSARLKEWSEAQRAA